MGYDARAVCTCAICGKQFEAKNICPTRWNADMWEWLAPKHYTKCPECWESRNLEQEEHGA